MQYSDNGFPTDRNPNLEYKHTYWLLIDLGAYRTTVLCWPNGEDLRDVSVLSEYLISQPSSELIGFPSAFMKKNRMFSFVSDQAMEEIDTNDYIESAKTYFAEEYSAHKYGAEEFAHYVKNLLNTVFTIIAKPDTKSVWNYKEIPVIEGLKLTVPDLFIENLREGYCDIIHNVCQELREENPDCQLMLADRFFNDTDQPFVQISADENGAAELYFINNVQTLPFLNLSKDKDRARNLPDALELFQTLTPALDVADKEHLILACCVIDIGGLTTDASTTVLKFVPNQKIADLEAHLLMKTSLSEPKAGKHLKQEYQKYAPHNKGEWWDDPQFLAANEVNFLRIIIQEQYQSIQAWQQEAAEQQEAEALDGVYFILSGRPTQSPHVQKLLTQLILETFNQAELLIMKEHCLFMSDYPHIWRDGSTRRAVVHQELAKLVTVVGNLYSLQLSYSIDEQLICYYIQVQLDQEHEDTFALMPGDTRNLEEYDFFRHQLEKANPARQIKLEFSKQPHGKYQQFLSVSGRLQSKDISCYPQLCIGGTKSQVGYQDRVYKRWILPSIYVENLEAQREYFKLAWSDNE